MYFRYSRQRITALALLIVLSGLTVTQTACPGAQDVQSVENKLNSAAHTLRAAAQTNHRLFLDHKITIETRQKVARIINSANSKLAMAVDRAADIDPANPESGKQAVIDIMRGAVADLETAGTGNAEIDAALHAAAVLVNEAISLTQALKAKGAK